jgi:hypothetical protein
MKWMMTLKKQYMPILRRYEITVYKKLKINGDIERENTGGSSKHGKKIRRQ